jgi:hypothetical protein
MAEAKKRGDLGKAKKSKSKKKSGGKHPHEIHLRRATSGELLAKHIHKGKPGEMPPPDEEHIVPEGGLDEHVAEHMPPEQEAQAAPAPQPGGMLGGM